MKVAVDSSSIILLAKAGLLMEACKLAELLTTKEVEAEVMRGLAKGKADAAKRLIEGRKIRVVNPNARVSNKLQEDFGLGLGEATALALVAVEKIALLTDDNKARKAGKILGAQVLSSLDFPVVLFAKKVIQKERAVAAVKSLQRHGWFNESLIIEALAQLEKMGGEKK